MPKLMFCWTVYQGKRACSWNTTPRSQLGRSTSWPSTTIRPALGRSKPAIRLSSVVFPQPLWPTIAKNSCCLTSNEMLRSACTGSPRVETNTLETFCTNTVDTVSLSPPPVGSYRCGRGATRATVILRTLRLAMPGEKCLRHPAHGHVDEQTEDADGGHAHHDHVGGEQGPGVRDEVAESRRRRYQLSRDQPHPADAEANPESGDDARQRAVEDDPPEERHPRRAQTEGGAD